MSSAYYCDAHPDSLLQTITSRSLLVAEAGKAAGHANLTKQHLMSMHGMAVILKCLIASIGAALQRI